MEQIKVTFIIAICIFEIGSLLCGVAPTSVALIIGRAVAGLGTGGIFSGAVVIMAYCCKSQLFPPLLLHAFLMSYLQSSTWSISMARRRFLSKR